MSEGLARLQGIGAQKIYEKTHIPIEQIQAILYESFEDFTKVQFMGFVSILEREYGEDLSELKAVALSHFNKSEPEDKPAKVFVTPKRKKNFSFIYIFAIVLIIIIAFVYRLNSSNDVSDETVVDNKVIENITSSIKPIDTNVTDENSTQKVLNDVNTTTSDTNVSVVLEVKPVIEETKVPKSFKILTKNKVWTGYINIKTNQHYSKTVKHELRLKADKNWLLVFGHSQVDFDIDGKKFTFSRGNTRFLYRDGVIEPITLKEFKKLNKGRKW